MVLHRLSEASCQMDTKRITTLDHKSVLDIVILSILLLKRHIRDVSLALELIKVLMTVVA